ncbi:MAG: leucine-rich repeat domain-containing protein [Marinilabiliaceae bacterium]
MKSTAFYIISAIALTWGGTAAADSKGTGWTLVNNTLTISKDYAWSGYVGEWASSSSGIDEIVKVVLEEGVTTIGASAFEGCENLAEVSIPSTVETIGNHAFRYCNHIESVKLPEGLKRLGEGAFENCGGLSEINIPSGITEIAPNAFNACNIAAITLPEGLKTIGKGAFSTTPLASIELPEGLTSIGDEAFLWCYELQTVSLPSTIESVGKAAFMNCTGLVSITCLATEPPAAGAQATDGCDGVTLFVPAEAKDAYKASEWADRLPRILAIGETAINSVSANERICVVGMVIYVDGKPAKDIYSLTGKKVSAEKPLCKGIYLVRTSKGNRKVVVK